MIYTRKNLHGMYLILLTVVCTALIVPFAYSQDTCVNCHKDDKFRVQNRILFDYYQNWTDSLHDLAGVECIECHGGDATRSDKEKAHKDNFSSLTSIDKSAYKEIPQRCGKCHESILKNFTKSKHYKALQKEGAGPQCVTCHGSMNAAVYYTSVIARACKDCHNEYTKNRPEVVGEADKILHRINVSRAFKNWITVNYGKSEPSKVVEINKLYDDVANSWHTFNFEQLDEKSEKLLNKLKAYVNRGLAEKKMKKQ
jgi:formate-dependent nitrite reductase cytochrome c552 subunit